MVRRSVWFHRARATAWLAFGLISFAVGWANSVALVWAASVYANVMTDWTAAEAADDRRVLAAIAEMRAEAVIARAEIAELRHLLTGGGAWNQQEGNVMATKRLKVTGGYLEVEVDEVGPIGADPGTDVPGVLIPGADPGPGVPGEPIGGTDPAVQPEPTGPAEPATGPTDPLRPDPQAPPTDLPGVDAPPRPDDLPLSRNDAQHEPTVSVRTWQQAATDAGFDVGRVDGFFGPKTEAGVIAVQNACGLAPTGGIDAATWDAAHHLPRTNPSTS